MAPFFTYLLYSQISKKYLTMETAGSTMDWPGSEISASELFRDRGMMRTTSSLGQEIRQKRLTVELEPFSIDLNLMAYTYRYT